MALWLGLLVAGCAGLAWPPAAAAAADGSGRSAPTQGKLDLNSASLEEILALPIPEPVARAIHEFRTYVRYFENVYDLGDVEGVTPDVLAALKPLVAVLPPTVADQAIARMTASNLQVSNYLGQEGSNEGLVDEYLDLLQEPVNVNDLDLFELMSFQNVSPVDATAILRARDRLGGFADARQLRGAEGLRYYSFRTMRDFVVYDDRDFGPDDQVRGDYQVRYYDTPIFNADTEFTQLDVDIGADFLTRNVQLLNPNMSHKVRVDLPYGVRAGARSFRGLGEAEWDETLKAFVEVKGKDLGPFRLKRAVAGSFRAAFGQGLVMDNTDFIHFRKTGYGWNVRPLGIRGDLSRTHEYALTGGAVEGSLGDVNVILLGSSDRRDGILNPDGTVNRYVTMNPRPTQMFLDDWLTESGTPTGLRRDAFREDLLGANLKYLLAPGTYVGATALHSSYDRAFDARPATLIAGGSESDYWEARDSELAAGYTSVVEDAAAGTRTEYKWRRIYGAEAQAVYGNVAVQGEYAWLQDPRAAFLHGQNHDAWILNSFAQWENLHLLAIYRDYDVGFDNPYMRSFSNDSKYEQTILDSPYRLEDDLYGWLSTDNPQPKGERGLFFDMRYRLSRQLIINGLQYDQWERKADGADQMRYTANLEYQPKFNLRFRLRHRVSSRTEHNTEDVRTFRSWENRLQMIALLSHYNRFVLTYSTSNVNFPARQRLAYPPDPGDPNADDLSGVGMRADPAHAVEARYEHNVTPWLKLSAATSVYDGFLWNFEGNEFVLLDNLGFRNWFKVESRISDRTLFQLKVTRDHGLPGTYLDIRDFGDELPPTPDATYVPRDDLYVRLQIDHSF
ncbi:MAG TPA: helix-hairpin-helix domain-containing protein [Candidatus Krumholzibacteria bacterium]|nr:helix-hairpin-helix domain-containing protein [Candidatus Krumholzibacteria bacterium]HPD72114.1 helix-hairpin-helix domain-containing protein [Candidatus Krumholzibacteria bacterium]HRY40954.1 helix-hairpin-helix domain-containing protein [Candidatus Krumholzibacteria bacterium]